MMEIDLAGLGFTLIFLGFMIVFLAVILMMIFSLKSSAKVRGGGIVFLGPIPIGFATDKEAFKWLVILAIIMIILMLIFMIPFKLT